MLTREWERFGRHNMYDLSCDLPCVVHVVIQTTLSQDRSMTLVSNLLCKDVGLGFMLRLTDPRNAVQMMRMPEYNPDALEIASCMEHAMRPALSFSSLTFCWTCLVYSGRRVLTMSDNTFKTRGPMLTGGKELCS